MRHTKLGARVTLSLWIILITFIPGQLLSYSSYNGLKVFFLALMNLSCLWAIQRVWSYQPSTEREQRVQLTKLKLGYTLVFACMFSLSLYMIIDLIVGVDTIYTLDLLFLPGIGLLAFSIGCVLLFQGKKLKPESP